MAFDGTNKCWVPRVPIADNARWRMRVAQASEGGYQQRMADGLNPVERNWSLVWETKPKADLVAMNNYLAATRGYAFPFRHPVTGVVHNVFCDEWEIDWNVSLLTTDPTLSQGAFSASARYGTLSAEFRKANGVTTLRYPAWLIDPSEVPATFYLDFVNNRSWDWVKGASDAAGQVTVVRAGTATFNAERGTWRSVAADAIRRDSRGVLVEGARTNSIRNNTWAGAAPGSPGTQPTYWAQMNASSGVTYSIVRTGVEDGIDFIDIRWVGTNTGAGTAALGIWYPPNTSAMTPVANGDRWTSSMFVRLIGGGYTYIDDTDPFNPIIHSILNSGVVTWEAVEGGAAQGAGISKTLYNATDDELTAQRVQCTRQVSVALTTRIFTQYRMDLPAGAMCDITLRFGWPQLEKGAYATTPILTATAPASRAADIITVNNPGSIIKDGTGTFYVQFNHNQTAAQRATGATVPASWLINASNYQTVYVNGGTGFPYAQNIRAGVNDFDGLASLPVLLDTAKHKMAFATATNNSIAAKDGLLTGPDTSSTPIVGVATLIHIGSNAGNPTAHPVDGFVQEFAYWPQRLTNAQLSEATSV